MLLEFESIPDISKSIFDITGYPHYENDDYWVLLLEFESIPDISKSIFDITGYPHYENVSSNILAFYLNPNNEHGLGNLLYSSLMNLSGGNESQPDNIQINREVSTQKGGSLDIVIETDTQIIGIENKIRHHLHNDLADYSATLDEWAGSNQLDAIKIILSTKKEQESSGFVCITYEKFWKKIGTRLGDYVSTSSQKWLLYLIDFMNTIENFRGGNIMELTEKDRFFIKYDEKVNKFFNDRNEFMSKLHNRVGELKNLMAKEQQSECEKLWVYAKSCLVHVFRLSDHLIEFDLYISPNGWELQLYGTNKKSQSYLSELLNTDPLQEYKPDSMENSSYILKRYDLATDLDKIKDELLKWFDLLLQSEKNKRKS